MKPGLWGFARATVIFMVLRPLTAPFLGTVRRIHEARRLMKEVSTIARQPSQGQEEVLDDAIEGMLPLRRRSRRQALIFLLLSMGAWSWWVGHVSLGRWSLVGLPSLETVLLCGALGLQSLVQSYTNWRARGNDGGFDVFLASGKDIWPR